MNDRRRTSDGFRPLYGGDYPSGRLYVLTNDDGAFRIVREDGEVIGMPTRAEVHREVYRLGGGSPRIMFDGSVISAAIQEKK